MHPGDPIDLPARGPDGRMRRGPDGTVVLLRPAALGLVIIMLGAVVEHVGGETLDAYTTKHIFTPLKMARTRFLPPASWRPKIAPTQYDENEHMLRGVVHDPTARQMGGVAGHAGLFSTADDTAKFAQVGNPQVGITIDRERASALGISASQIETALYNAYGGRRISTLYGATDQYSVLLELHPRFQRDITDRTPVIPRNIGLPW